ncbi:hypothetical protein JCM16161A_13470 [Vulcanisaeta sp. JCM 16161]|uniref:type VII toxin-antitoxin system MntA family adenylyltransferase antitoxin n=1 Tax=Vulcanisaeta sp. JCM 16161 TaxID=1295372 RepID=UPI00406CF10B
MEVRELIRDVAVNRNMLAHAYRSFSRDELLGLRAWVLRNIPALVNQLLSLINKSGIDPSTSGEMLNRVFARHGVVLAFLFGSRARGSAGEDSDYDIAVLARGPLNHEEVVELVKDLADALGVPVDKVDLVDLSRAPNELVYVVLRDGVPIYAVDWELARRLVARMYVRILGESDLDYVYYRVFRDRISKKRY